MADWSWLLLPGPGLLEEGLMAAAALRKTMKRNPTDEGIFTRAEVREELNRAKRAAGRVGIDTTIVASKTGYGTEHKTLRGPSGESILSFSALSLKGQSWELGVDFRETYGVPVGKTSNPRAKPGTGVKYEITNGRAGKWLVTVYRLDESGERRIITQKLLSSRKTAESWGYRKSREAQAGRPEPLYDWTGGTRNPAANPSSPIVQEIHRQLIAQGINPRLSFVEWDANTLKVSRGVNGSLIRYNQGTDLYDVTEYHGSDLLPEVKGIYAEGLLEAIQPSFSPREGYGSERNPASPRRKYRLEAVPGARPHEHRVFIGDREVGTVYGRGKHWKLLEHPGIEWDTMPQAIHYAITHPTREREQNPALGIKFVYGIRGRGKSRVSEVQSVMFDKDSWTRAAAVTWLREHGFKSGAVDEGRERAGYLRFRQEDPKRYHSFRVGEPGAATNPDGTISESRINQLLSDWHEAGRASFEKHYPSLDYDTDQRHAAIWQRKYILLNEGTSGAFAVDRADGNVYRIKAYGVPNKRKLVGHINELAGLDLLVKRWMNPESGAKNPIRIAPVGAYYSGVAAGQEARMLFDSDDTSETLKAQIRQDMQEFRRATDDYARGYMRGWMWRERVRNPNSGADLYHQFHGRPSTRTLEYRDEITEPDEYAGLGDLTEIKVRTLSGLEAVLSFKDNPPLLAASPDGRQLVLQGGDQSLDLKSLKMDSDKWLRDSMTIGVIDELTYSTEKQFHKFNLTDYYHRLGEETGVQPFLLYDPANQLLAITGGQYQVKREGIVN